jgi:hypothetical protein
MIEKLKYPVPAMHERIKNVCIYEYSLMLVYGLDYLITSHPPIRLIPRLTWVLLMNQGIFFIL